MIDAVVPDRAGWNAGGSELPRIGLDLIAIDVADLDSPVALSGDGRFEGSDFSIEAELGSVRELFDPTEPFPMPDPIA